MELKEYDHYNEMANWSFDHIKYDVEEFTTWNYENEIALIFKKFPQLNISEIANSIGIHKSLLAKYIYGIKKPSEQRKQEIKNALHDLGKELLAV